MFPIPFPYTKLHQFAPFPYTGKTLPKALGEFAPHVAVVVGWGGLAPPSSSPIMMIDHHDGSS